MTRSYVEFWGTDGLIGEAHELCHRAFMYVDGDKSWPTAYYFTVVLRRLDLM